MAETVQDLYAYWDSPEGKARCEVEAQRVAQLPPVSSDWLEKVEQGKLDRSRYEAARREHLLYGTLDGIGSDAIEVSEAPRRRINVRDFKNGHVEALAFVVRPRLQDTLDRAIDRDLARLGVSRGDGDVESNAVTNGRRAKRDVRLYCKLLGVSSLWTLTYRGNQCDRALARKHLTAFVRRVRAVIPDFRYIAVAEKQKRGALHWHIATHGLPMHFKVRGHKVKSWNLLRSIWRSVVGQWGGNFDESKGVKKWKREGRAVRAGAIGRYVSKYIAKGFEETELNAHRFSRSLDATLPDVQRIEVAADMSMREIIELCYAAVGDGITMTRFDAENGVFFIESDDSGLIGCGPS